MFEIEQTYDMAGLTVLCRTARKTVRTYARILRIVCWCIFGLCAATFALLLALGGMPEAWMWAALLVFLLLLLLEDRFNAWIALRNLVPGTAHSTAVFDDDAYTVTTEKTQTRWQYDNITALCESERYFIFFLGKKHGQLFDKQGFRTGEPDAFRAFLEQKTGKTFEKVK